MGRIMVVLFADGEEDVYQKILQIMNDSKGFEWYDIVQEPENIQEVLSLKTKKLFLQTGNLKSCIC